MLLHLLHLVAMDSQKLIEQLGLVQLLSNGYGLQILFNLCSSLLVWVLLLLAEFF